MLGLDADQEGNAPAGPVGPDIMMDRIQPVAQGPVGQNYSDRPTDDGPVGRFITHSPVGPDRILYTCDSDRPVADGPMDRFLKLGPVGPKRTFSLDKLNQPVADGPMDRFLKIRTGARNVGALPGRDLRCAEERGKWDSAEDGYSPDEH